MDELSLDDVGELLLYWQQHPPVHIQLSALARGLTGAGKASRPSPAGHGPGPSQTAPEPAGAEQLTALLGVPTQKFHPLVHRLSAERPAADPDPN